MLDKLSVSLLNDAVTRVEYTESKVFAFITNKDVFPVLGRFVEAIGMPDSTRNRIWGSPLFIDNSTPHNSVVLACCDFVRDPAINDMRKAMMHLFKYNPYEKYLYGDMLSDNDIWGLVVNLS